MFVGKCYVLVGILGKGLSLVETPTVREIGVGLGLGVGWLYGGW